MLPLATQPENDALGNALAVSRTWESQNHCPRSSMFQKVTTRRQIQSSVDSVDSGSDRRVSQPDRKFRLQPSRTFLLTYSKLEG